MRPHHCQFHSNIYEFSRTQRLHGLYRLLSLSKRNREQEIVIKCYNIRSIERPTTTINLQSDRRRRSIESDKELRELALNIESDIMGPAWERAGPATKLNGKAVFIIISD